MDTKPISHTPRSLRVRLGLTRRELARAAGVGERTIARIEDGSSTLVDTLRKVAAALGVSMDGLIEAIDAQASRRVA